MKSDWQHVAVGLVMMLAVAAPSALADTPPKVKKVTSKTVPTPVHHDQAARQHPAAATNTNVSPWKGSLAGARPKTTVTPARTTTVAEPRARRGQLSMESHQHSASGGTTAANSTSSASQTAARLGHYHDPQQDWLRHHHHQHRRGTFLWKGFELSDQVLVLSDDRRTWSHTHQPSISGGPGYPVHQNHENDEANEGSEGHCRGEWSTSDGSHVAWSGDKVHVNESPNPNYRWKVWGDPHILNPNGTRLDFSRSNGLFEMPDGTRLVMIATGPKAHVHDILVFPKGVALGGFDFEQTTNYGRPVNGRFRDMGPATH